MKHRLITHKLCLDGFFSALIFKKYFKHVLEGPIEEFHWIPPDDAYLETFDFQKGDIVLDLPRPKKDVFFWADHHTTNEYKGNKKNYYYKPTKSCTGLLAELAQQKGIAISKKDKQLIEVEEKIDSATLTKNDIREIMYAQKSYDTPSPLLHTAIIGSLIGRDNEEKSYEQFKDIMKSSDEEDIFDNKTIQSYKPLQKHMLYLKSLDLWRKSVISYVTYNKKSKVILQDSRMVKKIPGTYDRWYLYEKYPEAVYSVVVKHHEDGKRIKIGIGVNIYKKKLRKVDIGELCEDVGKRYGEGSGGGHPGVGSCKVFEEKADEAKKYIFKKLDHART